MKLKDVYSNFQEAMAQGDRYKREMERLRRFNEKYEFSENIIILPKEYGLLSSFIKEREDIDWVHFSLLLKLFQKIDQYNFRVVSSVDDCVESCLDNENYERTKVKLADVTLKDHTYRVFKKAIKHTQGTSTQIASLVGILALAHDFGKSPMVKEELLEYGVLDSTISSATGDNFNKRTHSQLSAEYLYLMALESGLTEEAVKMRDILFSHHSRVASKNLEPQAIFLMNFLNRADREAREEEIELIATGKIK